MWKYGEAGSLYAETNTICMRHAGANSSSMMAQRVAINGLADSYMAFNTNYHDTGLFGVYATCNPKTQPADDLVRPPPAAPPHVTATGCYTAVLTRCNRIAPMGFSGRILHLSFQLVKWLKVAGRLSSRLVQCIFCGWYRACMFNVSCWATLALPTRVQKDAFS